MAKIVITCEHGGNKIPGQYLRYFKGKPHGLKSHRGYDIGAIDLFSSIASTIADYSISSTTSRLLIDLNRSPGNKQLFSRHVSCLDKHTRDKIIKRYYNPYHDRIRGYISRHISRHHILHISVHTFTPRLKGLVRSADIGLLFDPGRANEKRYCTVLKKEIIGRFKGIKIRFNYPYKGISDGLTTMLRKIHSGRNYTGIELEVNQKLPVKNQNMWNRLKEYMPEAIMNSTKALAV